VPQVGLRIIRSMFIYTLPFRKKILEPCVIEKVAATLWPQALRSLLQLCAAPFRLPRPPGRQGAEPEEAVVAALGHFARKKSVLIYYSIPSN
jgi:hypothetical protein